MRGHVVVEDDEMLSAPEYSWSIPKNGHRNGGSKSSNVLYAQRFLQCFKRLMMKAMMDDSFDFDLICNGNWGAVYVIIRYPVT